MSTYTTTCPDCGDSTITDGWSPTRCPFCELLELKNSMKPKQDPTRDPASEARDDHASNPAPVSPERPLSRMEEAWRAPQRQGDGFVTVPAIRIADSVMEEGRKLEKELEEMTRQRDALALAIRTHAANFGNIRWGHDGDCGSGLLVETLEATLAAVKGQQP